MLKPIQPKADADHFSWCVCDIENKPDGTVIGVDYCWRNDDGDLEHATFHNWPDAWTFLRESAKMEHRFRTVYAHNGGGWDWLSLAEYLIRVARSERDTLSAVTAGSSMVMLSVRFEKEYTIAFCDSLQLLRSSLDKLARKMLGEGKVDTGGKLPHELLKTDPAKYWRYLHSDTELLVRVLERSIELLKTICPTLPRLGRTIGATAMLVFRSGFLDREISVPDDPEVKDFLRLGYRGGRVEVFAPGYYPSVNVYDVNSLYPSVMAETKVPISGAAIEVKNGSILDRDSVGVYRIRFLQHDRSLPPVLQIGGVGAYSGEGVYFSPELVTLLRHDPSAEISIERGYVFPDVDVIFENYVRSLYSVRQSDPNGPISLLAKFLLNSLYGKFGQKALREKMVAVHDFDDLYDMIENGAQLTVLDDDSFVYSLEEETTCVHEHVGIAGVITSAARARLYDGMVMASRAGRLVYCDTDSLHVCGSLSRDCISGDLGAWKLEFSGEGAYAGKKLYALRDSDGSEKIRAKGVSVGGTNGARLCFDDVRAIAVEEKSVVCEFLKPATPREVFRGKTACSFQPRKRTLKRTAQCPV